jgi:hypothetical protein
MSSLFRDGGGAVGSELSITQESEKIDVPDWFLRYFKGSMAQVLLSVPKEFETTMLDRVNLNPPLLPVTQILGFSQFTAQAAEVLASQTTTSTTYADLATVGPQLTGLAQRKLRSPLRRLAIEHSKRCRELHLDFDQTVARPATTTQQFSEARPRRSRCRSCGWS